MGKLTPSWKGLLEGVARRPLAAHDTVRIDQQELDGFDVGMSVDEVTVFTLMIGRDEPVRFCLRRHRHLLIVGACFGVELSRKISLSRCCLSGSLPLG
jgi:hypothetical protein